MNASVLSIGNELLSGLVVNTNASFIAQILDEIGVGVTRIDTVSDEKSQIISVLNHHMNESDIVIITGGLGPTSDDVTKKTLSERFGMELVFHQPSYDNIVRLFHNRGGSVSETNRQQAMLPKNCTVLNNTQGTAPGMWFEVEGKFVISLPGVPFEMKYLMEMEVIPRLKCVVDEAIILRKMFYTTGISESHLHDRLSVWEDSLDDDTQLAYLPEPGVVKLRLTVSGQSRELVGSKFSQYEKQLKAILDWDIFGEGDDTLESVVGQLLADNRLTLAVAESCSGGLLSHLITSVPGSSRYFKGGVVSYANEVKMGLLKVDAGIIETQGAVSEAVVVAMALGVKELLQTDYALSVSGIAGPEGGSAEKPVGTVWIAIASPSGVSAIRFQFGEHRLRNIKRSAMAALNMLRLQLLDSF